MKISNSMKTKLTVLASLLLVIVLVPTIIFAQSGPSDNNPPPSTPTQTTNPNTVCPTPIKSITDLICKMAEITNALIPFLVALGMVYFVWGVVTYMIASDEEAKKKGKNRIIYGIIGFVVILGVWGLVTIITNTFGIAGQSVDISSLTTQNDQASSLSCTLATNPKLGALIDYVVCLIGHSIIPLIFTLAVAMFVWGVVRYVIGANEEKEREKGKEFMIWGIIALAVMIGVWGLVAIVTNTFGVSHGQIFIPQVKQ